MAPQHIQSAVYSVAGWSAERGSYWVKAAEVYELVSKLDDPDAPKVLAAIDRLCREGCRYSNQDCDVLGSGLNLVGRHRRIAGGLT